MRLIARLAEPSHGRITLWHDIDVSTVPRDTLRERIGFISQEPFLFDDTLLWNLRYGDLAAPPSRLAAAAAAAELPLLDSQVRVGERGARLSGGERQRVAVARALLREAPLLLADEAASAVDTPTEAKLVEALRRGTRRADSGDASRTLITVVHRLPAVTPLADRIVVFAAGRVVEQGTHVELLANEHGEYARLWRAQELQAQPGATPYAS